MPKHHKKTTFEEQLNKDGILVFTNKGVSMMPLLRQNKDLMIIEKKGSRQLKKYDAVLFKRKNGQYVLHRILKVLPHEYWIVGDNCISGEYIQEEQILGILTGVVRDQRKISENDYLYKAYVHLWCDCYPVRFKLLIYKNYIRRCLSYMKRHLLKK